MLLQLRDFIRRRQFVSVQQITREFAIDEETLQPMLDIWLKRGSIQSVNDKTGCNTTCTGCKTTIPRYYTFLQ